MRNTILSIAFFASLGAFSLASAASIQGYGAMGEDLWPSDAASLGRGFAGSATLNEGFSVLNPARMAFENKTRFQASLEYQGVYASENGNSIGRDNISFSNMGLSVPLGMQGALGVGVWQRTYEDFSATSWEDTNEVYKVQHSGGIMEIVPAMAFRLPAKFRFVALGVAWHFPVGHSSHIWKGHPDTTGMDSTLAAELVGLTVSDRLFIDWSGEVDGMPFDGYPGFSIQVHKPLWDYFASAQMAHTIVATYKRSMRLSNADTTTSSRSRYTQHIPWQFGTGITLEPWKSHQISFEFHQRSGSDTTGHFGDDDGWIEIPANYSLNKVQRIYSVGWQRNGSGIFYDPFLRRNTFRAGAWTRTWYLEGVREYAGTLGFGMPLGKRGAMLDLGLYVGSRDFDAPLEGSEVFWGVRLGLTGIGEWGKDSHKRR